jgi:hypothetical protein
MYICPTNYLSTYMKHTILSLILLAWGAQAYPQTTENVPSDATFTPPFDFPITFSGNFGEIRANHFHGGLDFKTGGTIGKPVHALAEGYISRIRVTHGSGYVLDVAYNNGYKTINRHLSAFVGDVARRVEDLQYEKESWEVEITPEPGEYPVKAGQVIALSGNTGYSFGPHLHLDMFEADTDDYIDPLPFFKKKVKDNTAPRAEGIMLFPQPGRGVVDGNQKHQAFPLTPKQPITAWGLVGSAIRAYDYMDGVSNRYGVHTVILEVDSVEVFRSVVDRFSEYENRMINSWTYGQYMKSFIEPGNTLRMLHALNGNRGLVDINEERPYRFVYTLKDALGNTSKVRFTIHGKRAEIKPVEHREKYIFHWNKVNILQEPGLNLVIPRGMLYEDVALNCHVVKDTAAISYEYQLHDEPVALQAGCTLMIGVRHLPVEDTSKYYVARKWGKRKGSAGGIYENGWMKTSIRELGTYTVAIDTLSPRVTPLNKAQWKTGKVQFKIGDAETGIKDYKVKIDGEFALFGFSSKNAKLWMKHPERLKKGVAHKLELVVTDYCGNETKEEYEF